MDEHKVLKCNPFEGDFGEPNDRVLRDKIVTARKGGKCHLCCQDIKPGERIRSQVDVFSKELVPSKWCNACCEAMAASWNDNGNALEKRAALRRMRAEMAAQE